MTISGIRTSGRPASNYRWVICGLLFLITTINYMDRNILGVLKPTIQGDLHFSETDFGNIIFFFSIAYAIGYAGMGWLTDKIGIRLGLAAAAILWCLASTAHGMVGSVSGFILARIVLGLGEGGNFPTCIKTIATWFPVRDRAFATGIFNSGSNIGAMLAPLIGALVVALSGWQAAFYVTGAVGLVWVVFWLISYRNPAEHPRVSSSELAYINQDPEVSVQKVPWSQVADLSRHLGLHRRRRADQSGLVVLQQLGAELPQLQVPRVAVRRGIAAGTDLSAHRCRLDRRRLGLFGPDQERHGRVPRPQDHAADLRRLHGAGIPCAAA